ncbi:hypothetical protein [uncultured Bacteroides sp.]|uniref:hypothetical protein n=1 Tax=uncultured Bacteroides sp. TaxID=162156 RepID=UPI0025953F97|nr:hypothetical protein [uncultured Bacteroides sp.]
MSVKFYLMLALSAVAVLVGCKDDEEVVTPQFPDLKEQTVTLTETTDENGNNVFSASLDITFSANLDWTLKSDAAWCRFVNGEFKEGTASGKAGDQTLKIEISPDDGWDYTIANVAQITLSMGGKKQVIYKITVSSMELQGLVVTNEAGEILGVNNPLTIKGSGLRDIELDKVYTVITAVSQGNAENIGIAERPEWLTITNAGNGTFNLIFNNENDLEEPINSFGVDKGYKIVVSDGETNVEIPLAYEGLKAESLSFIDKETDGYPTKLYASMDGTKFIYRNSNGMTGEVEEQEFDAPLSTNITARDGKYHVLVLGMSEETAPNQAPYYNIDVDADVSWVEYTTNGTNIELSVKALEGDKRGATVMVFSEAYWNAIQTDSLPKYNNSLRDAIFTSELVYSNTEEGEMIYGYMVKNEYEANKWVDIFQEEEQVIEGISFEPFIYSYEVFMSLEDFYGQDPSYKDYIKIENVSGTSDASNELGISNVWKITCSNMLTTSDMSLAIQANGLEANDLFGAMSTPDGVTINNLNKDGNTLVNVVAPNYIGEFEFIVMGSDESFKALLKIEITGN